MTLTLAARPREVVLVGAGQRARAWLEPLRRSARLRAVATVGRGGDSSGPDLAAHGSLDEAMRAHPGAAFAVALPPRSGLESALQLAEAGRQAVVEAPLHEALQDAVLGPGAAGVRVAHGWVTLAGRRAVDAILQRSAHGRFRIEMAGLPEEASGDVEEVLVHAAALVHSLWPGATPSTARWVDGGGLEIEVLGSTADWSGQLSVRTRGPRLAVRVEAPSETTLWSWEGDRESVIVNGKAVVASRPTPPAEVRALAQLLPDAERGDGLAEAVGALRLARTALALLPGPLALGARAFRQSASISRRRPTDVLARLGLRGELPGSGPAPGLLTLSAPEEPFELWAFRAGIKPVAFLTVRPDEVDRTLAFFGDSACERRERRVQVEAQDRWTDRRDEGEPRVELYIAREAELAQRAAHLQAETDPTVAIRELGALVGYPHCCVEAFARQDDRANNSRNRYQTEARTRDFNGSMRAPWPWELNNLHTVLVPFYPCSYRCEAALVWARRALEELERKHASFVRELRLALSRPVLYFDHDHQLVLEGEYADGGATYRCVALAQRPTAPEFGALAAAVGLGNRLVLDDRSLVVERDGRIVLRLDRTDPGLGFVAPFGVLS